tara:strand:+ start:334 stop:549 length:216 start_codon:yes stop_codon:yes gene_type:complete
MLNESTIKISAASHIDLHLALTWVKANDGIKSLPKIKKSSKGYTASVVSKISKNALTNLVKDRFGVFIKVG